MIAPPVLLFSLVLESGGHDAVESELPPVPERREISRLVTISPLIWDAQAIQINTVRDGRRRVSVVGEAPRPWQGLPVWITRVEGGRRFQRICLAECR